MGAVFVFPHSIPHCVVFLGVILPKPAS
jgi:hypothetical protein